MCDTQVMRHGEETLFAKNSDREPDEPQLIRCYPAVRGDTATSVQATYITVDQVPDRHALILSQPAWIWGAEIGVNEHGLVIGNEAVFTRCVQKSGEALLGMDILRLALERCRLAGEAIHCIDALLGKYGQGGPAGYRDKTFRYDNSFIIADTEQAWVMETAGRHWVAKRVARFGAISNALSIRTDFDLQSEGLEEFARVHGRYSGRGKLDFALAFDTKFMKFMGRAEQRRGCSLRQLSSLEAPGLRDMAGNLRAHAGEAPDFSAHGNADVCMHAGGILRPSQTTGSMLVRSAPGAPPEVYVTGTSAPCLSLFQPVDFKGDAAPVDAWPGEQPLWHRFEVVHQRALRDRAFCARLRSSRDGVEASLFDSAIDVRERQATAAQWHDNWHAQALSREPPYRRFSPYDRFWRARRQATS